METLTAKFKGYYTVGNYTRTGNKDSRGVITINYDLRDVSYHGYEMKVVPIKDTYYTHKIVECSKLPDAVGNYIHKNFVTEVLSKEETKLLKVWGD